MCENGAVCAARFLFRLRLVAGRAGSWLRRGALFAFYDADLIVLASILVARGVLACILIASGVSASVLAFFLVLAFLPRCDGCILGAGILLVPVSEEPAIIVGCAIFPALTVVVLVETVTVVVLVGVVVLVWAVIVLIGIVVPVE